MQTFFGLKEEFMVFKNFVHNSQLPLSFKKVMYYLIMEKEMRNI